MSTYETSKSDYLEYKRMFMQPDEKERRCLVCGDKMENEKGDVHKVCARRSKIQDEWDDRKFLRKYLKKLNKGRNGERLAEPI